jgi:hypothetical protein
MARTHLAHTAQHVGLAQLVLAPALRTTEGMNKATGQLTLAADRLQHAVGGDPQGLLGLHGRITLVLLEVDPYDPLAGVTKVFRNADPNQARIEVHAEAVADTLLHEWFHAMDLAIAPLMHDQARVNMTWTAQRGFLGWGVKRPDLDAAWRHASRAQQQRTQWGRARLYRAWKEKNPYWLSGSEAQAYAFSKWTTMPHFLPCRWPNHTGTDARPGAYDAACMGKAWQPYWPAILQALAPESQVSARTARTR